MAKMNAGMEALKEQRDRLKTEIQERRESAERFEQAASEARGVLTQQEERLAEVEEALKVLVNSR